MSKRNRFFFRLLAIAIGALFLVMVPAALAQDDEDDAGAAEDTTAVEGDEVQATDPVPDAVAEEVALTAEEVQFSLDMVWILIAGFLVFLMQAGFAFLEAGFIRQNGAVNSLLENFMDAAISGVVFFLIGFGIAYGETSGGLFGTSLFALDGASGTDAADARMFLDFFYQFAFAAAAGTIATGAMAERTNFLGKLAYSVITIIVIYPVVVHWQWSGAGWLSDEGFLDFAGSTVVHQVGGVLALVGAWFLGPRRGVDPTKPPRPHNLGLATLGTFLLWFGWYGFNVGSTLDATSPITMGLTAVNTTIAAAAGALATLFFVYFRSGTWDLGATLNGSLAGLVGITASCAFVSPIASLAIGATAGVVVILSMDAVARAGIDDAVGAFAVHGACGMLGSLSIGFFGLEALTGSEAGLFAGGGVDLLITQIIGVVAVLLWTLVTSVAMFTALNALGILRLSDEQLAAGVDVVEHSASIWPDVLPVPGEGGSAMPTIGEEATAGTD